ncbi:glycosyltransferase family 2 protein [Halalkalicoccus jeotgali]|uniref:Glycosyl transferase n=1 Tax=Halalkalicoccus jeotgali (strain DSM 18796 / CECT 7217 / JCM 14584 / KCTC 4019 / B3) TaxID=795797 RepID=D8J7I2_HALJB|nr:glycosyltransferase family 2 protein [Halalkalicoccus jeotgali]ADJ14077.1 glycosyl transferase [Halalkalicoccus jeotgali B3]ELY33879.1 glycosyl transferase [Halalkalicoccus jeotgali B3]
MSRTESDPTVSVVVPYSSAHTPERMLEEAKRSIDRQSVRTETIVVEDPDGSGPAATRNRGIERASTRYVAFLDADDLWKPDKLERQLVRMDRTGAGLCLDGDPSMSRDDFFYELFVGDLNEVMSSIVLDTAQVDVRFEEELGRWEDHLFALEAASEGVCFCRETFTARYHETSMSSGRIDATHYLTEGKKYVSLASERVPEVRPFTYVFYRQMYFAMGYYRHDDGEYRDAMAYFCRSLQIGVSPLPVVGLLGSAVFYLLFDVVLGSDR